MKFLALVAAVAAIRIQEARELGGKAANEDAAFEAYMNAVEATNKARKVARADLVAARKEEVELKREIAETITQEGVVEQANKEADAARRAVFVSVQAEQKAWEGYMDAMDEALHYTK